MNKIPNRQAICQTLLKYAEKDKSIFALCSDSRGSAGMSPFFQQFPEQTVELGIAEQNLVSVAAGLASCGKKPYAFSPACFLASRSYEQAKVDCAYSNTNVKLIGISGGISYGALGMSHHSAQDIAAMAALPNMRVYLPSDRFQTAKLIEALLQDEKPAYVRVGRNPVEDIYSDEACPFELNRATWLRSRAQTVKAALIACGEMVCPALESAGLLDKAAVTEAAQNADIVVTVEEHSPHGGLGSMVAQVVGECCPKRVKCLSLPDAPVITGTSAEVFAHYGLTGQGIAKTVKELL